MVSTHLTWFCGIDFDCVKVVTLLWHTVELAPCTNAMEQGNFAQSARFLTHINHSIYKIGLFLCSLWI